jgi:hypothetical protein
LPLESLRKRRAELDLNKTNLVFDPSTEVGLRNAEICILTDTMSTHELANASATSLFALYADISRKLSKSIYSRAGVYLLVGVF